MLLNRDDAISVFQDVTAKRLSLRNAQDKEAHPHIICMAGPGTGKSRMADYGLGALKNASREKYPELAALANSEGALAVHITFNSGTPLCTEDITIGAEAAVGSRLLASYFGIDLSTTNFPTEAISRLKIASSVETIVNDHVFRHPGMDRKDVLIYIVIDDVSSITEKTNALIPNGKVYLKKILNAIASLYSRKDYFLVTMVTGTVLGPTSDILIGAQRPYINLAVPLLSVEQSVQLARDAFYRAGISFEISTEFKILLSDIGGIPRFVWEAINYVISNQGQNINFQEKRVFFRFRMRERYGMSTLLSKKKDQRQILSTLLSTALLRESVHPSSTCVDGIDCTWLQLENQGICFFSETNLQGLVKILLPLLHLESLMEPFPVTAALVRNLYDNKSQSWENFCMNYEALLMTQYVLQGRSQVSVGEYYHGALIGEKAKAIVLTLPSQLPITFRELTDRYPEPFGSS